MMTGLQNRLKELSDEKYAALQIKITPGILPENTMGVRVPILRKFAKEYSKEEEHVAFMQELPHKYYDENMLHGLLVEQIKDYDTCIAEIDRFLPYVDNWAVCDIMSPKVLKKKKNHLLVKIKEWSQSDKTYTCRFGIGMLMGHFLDEDFKEEYLEIPAAVKSEEYYVNMMIAWFYATAIAKQYEAVLPYLLEHRLGKWVHNKTIQKARESRRISEETKEYLKSLKIS